jgi:hypothetical protein
MSKRHQASRRRSYGRRQHEVHEREVRRPDEIVDVTAEAWTRRDDRFARLDLDLVRFGFAVSD